MQMWLSYDWPLKERERKNIRQVVYGEGSRMSESLLMQTMNKTEFDNGWYM